MRGWAAAAFSALASLVIATAAFAGGDVAPPRLPVNPHPGISSRPLATALPIPANGARRAVPGHCPGINLQAIKSGEKVPLSCLPVLPLRSAANTATPKATAKGGRYHPLAATGATVDLTAGNNCGTQGALYAIGCSLTWEATNNGDWSTTDTYADYQVLPNSTTATLVGTNGYAYNAPTAHVTVLSAQGTYAFFVYDVTAKVIVSIVYVNAGQSFSIGVYQDPYHTSSVISVQRQHELGGVHLSSGRLDQRHLRCVRDVDIGKFVLRLRDAEFDARAGVTESNAQRGAVTH